MKKILYLVFYLLLISCNGQVKKNSLGEYKLNGNVKFLKSSKFSAESRFGEVQKGKEIENSHRYLFNNVGNIIEHKIYLGSDLLGIIKYEYDKNNRLKIENSFTYDNILESKTTFIYENDTLRKSEFYIFDGSLFGYYIYEYSKDRTIKTMYDRNGIQGAKEEKIFNNNIIIEESYTYPNSSNNFSVKFEYAYETISKQKIYDNNHNLSSTTFFEYDKFKNPIKEISENYNLNEKRVKKYNYEYDKNGNWIKRIEIEENTPKNITERIIEYY